MAQVIKLKRTTDPDKPPATLAEGEVAFGLTDRPVRGWIGTPSGVEELFAGAAIEDANDDAVYGRSNGEWVKQPVLAPSPPPTAAAPGQLWWDQTSAQLFAWTGTEWVVAINAAKPEDGDFLPLAGGELTGNLLLHANPTQDMQCATKEYVDQSVSAGLSTDDGVYP